MLERVMNGLRKSTLMLSAVFIILMAAMEITEIFSRTFFSHSFLIVDEFAGYFMAAMVFTGLTNSYASGSFVRVEVVYNLFKGRLKFLINLVYAFLMLAFTAVFGYFSILTNYKSFKMGLVSNGFYRTPLVYPQFFMSLGIICFFIYVVLDIIHMIKEGAKK